MKLSDFHYDLPQSRIASHPLAIRDEAKLLHYQHGTINHHQFRDAGSLLPAKSLVVFNNTKVIPARLFLYRTTGARIELLLLHPVLPVEVHSAMESSDPVQWQCMIGNKKKWKDGEIIRSEKMENGVRLEASMINREDNTVELRWDTEDDFATIIELSGKLPLPPYLNRDVEEDDYERYQTVYARAKGAVAAPTAGLHFTERVFADLEERNIGKEYVTLHVGAGTFQPVKTDDPRQHDMHVEQIRLSRQNIERLIAHQGNVIAVGTTSMRVLESMYWFGVEAFKNKELPKDHLFSLNQHLPYQIPAQEQPDVADALKALLAHFDRHELDYAAAETGIYILPGYSFKLVDGIFTNFHLPDTTLMMLVAAFVGDDWKTIYQEALDGDYRFLSYGDSSLLMRSVG
ncbi:MAG: S-adenosylmethionine:tRNA ribosyltransferase-isomerase [Bacteroidia bacterium]